MSMVSGDRGARLRVTQAFIALLSIPEYDSASKTISIGMIGSCEIRMFNEPPGGVGEPPAVTIELFDHGASVSLECRRCHEIEDAVAAFDQLAARAEALE